jgi:hypothetical protein
MNSDPLGDVADAIHAHERFGDAVNCYLRNILAWRGELSAFNKATSSQARGNVIRYLMFLHFCNETRNSDNGATFERLANLCMPRERCGPRVLRTVLVVASAAGYLHTERGRFDKRLKVYQPTEKLMARTRQLQSYILACLDILVEGQDFARRPDRDPAFVKYLVSTSGRAFVEKRAVVGEHFDDLYPILCLDGGFATMMAVAGAHLAGQPAPSHQEIANRFLSSASQTRKILKLAHERELVGFSRDGRIADASRLVEVCKRYIARELSMYAKYSLGLESYFVQSRTRRPAARADKPAAVARRG